MDRALTALFYLYLALALTAPLLLVPAVLICRRSSNPLWKSALVLIPWVGLPLFSVLVKLPAPPSTWRG
jgi:hypothetical protein